MDQKNKQLEVDYAIGRDIRPEDISKISSTLQEWCDSCESVLHTIEIQIDRANTAKAVRTKHTEDLESEVSAVASAMYTLKVSFLSDVSQIATLKKTLKTHLTEMDDDFAMEYKESTSSTTSTTTSLDPRIKKTKNKAMKPSSGGKSWFKF